MSLRYRFLAAVALFLVGLVAYVLVVPQKEVTATLETKMDSTSDVPEGAADIVQVGQ